MASSILLKVLAPLPMLSPLVSEIPLELSYSQLALHDTATGTGSFFPCTIGGISGSLLWCVLFVIVLYLIYLKLANNCLSPFNKPHSFHTPSVTETPTVSEETTSLSHPPAVIDNPPPSKPKRFIVKFTKKARQDFSCECMNSMYLSLCHSSR